MKAIIKLQKTSSKYVFKNSDDVLVYRGGKKETTIKNLDSCKRYEFYLKFANDIEMTTCSESAVIVTAEDCKFIKTFNVIFMSSCHYGF